MGVVDTALAYRERGWCPIPYARGQKGPRGRAGRGWQRWDFGPAEIRERFDENTNVGLRLGAASGNLVDVDLDHPAARRLAARFLPKTGAAFGRGGKTTHGFFVCPDLPEGASTKFADPDHGTLLELRAQGDQQTMVPPSVHPSGELVEWIKNGEPEVLSYDELRAAAGRCAAASLIALRLGPEARHDPTLPLCGALLRAGLDREAVEALLRPAYEAGGGRDWADLERILRDTAAKLETRERVSGWPSLAELWGDQVCRRLREWLRAGDAGTNGPHFAARDMGGIECRPVEWLWEPYIPLRMLTLLDGDPELGKSLFALDRIARLSREGCRSLIASTEDPLEYVVVPRLRALGADLTNVRVLEGRDEHNIPVPFDLSEDDHVRQFAGIVRAWRPRLVHVDAIMSAVGGKTQTGTDNQVRPILWRMISLAEELGFALTATRHLRKQETAKAIYAGQGSMAFVAVARSLLLFARHPETDTQVVVAHAKCNVSARGSSLAYQIRDQGGQPVLDWCGEVEYTADDLLRPVQNPQSRASDERLECEQWLLTYFTGRDSAPTAEVKAAAVADGHNWEQHIWTRAREAIGIKAKGRGASATWHKVKTAF